MRSLGQGLFSSAPLLLVLAGLFWAGNTVLGRGLSDLTPPVQLAFARWTLATLIIAPFAWPRLRQDWATIRAHAPMIAFLAALGPGSYNTLLYIGLTHTPAVNALLVGASGPLLIAIAAYAAFGDRMTRAQALGVVLAGVGVVFIIARGDPSKLGAAEFNQGDLWVFAALASWGVYTAYLRRKPAIHWLSFAAVTFALAAVFNAPLAAVEHGLGRSLQADWTTAFAIAYVAVFPSVLSYIFFSRGVELIGANRAGAYLNLIPVFGVGLAIAFLGEQLQGFHAAGFLLIMGGVLLSARRAGVSAGR
ncbi:MAG: DMT family transporter [Hyphomicrobiales bacterium]|nr:DMT family transporter [Hyphomicrobiales bacterium]